MIDSVRFAIRRAGGRAAPVQVPFDPTDRPFEESYREPRSRVESGPISAGLAALRNQYYGAAFDWRRIDHDWLGVVEDVALKLDADTNNTSRAMAIELGGKVLLFPGDAQVGNWLSWQDHSWKTADGGGEITASALLSRTVLYKVGHHGSHNATLGDEGLELMVDRDP